MDMAAKTIRDRVSVAFMVDLAEPERETPEGIGDLEDASEIALD